MDQQQVQAAAKRLLSEAERGNKSALTEEINKLDGKDRLAVAREIASLNDESRGSSRAALEHLPDITLIVGKQDGREFLKDITIVTPGGKSVDVYDRPEEVKATMLLQTLLSGDHAGVNTALNGLGWMQRRKVVQNMKRQLEMRRAGSWSAFEHTPHLTVETEIRNGIDYPVRLQLIKPSGRRLEVYRNRDALPAHHERRKLMELADKMITNPLEKARFKANMDRFDRRSKQIKEMYLRQGLSESEASRKTDSEVGVTYKQISRLLEAKPKAGIPLTARNHKMLALQVMKNCASPTSIDQGNHGTCNVTTVESRLYTRCPSEAAKLVADVATTGRYLTKSGIKVVLDSGSIEPHGAAGSHPVADGERTLAGQLFQITAVNVHYARSKSSLRYEQVEPENADDTGERLMDYSTNPPKERPLKELSWWDQYVNGEKEVPIRSPHLHSPAIVDIYNHIVGGRRHNWFFENYELRSGSARTVKFGSPGHLANWLQESKDNGVFPVTILVHTKNEPFYSDSNAGAAGGSGGWHVVNITDFHPGSPPTVSLDNQWGSPHDYQNGRRMPVRDLYLSTLSPDNPKTLQKLR